MAIHINLEDFNIQRRYTPIALFAQVFKSVLFLVAYTAGGLVIDSASLRASVFTFSQLL